MRFIWLTCKILNSPRSGEVVGIAVVDVVPPVAGCEVETCRRWRPCSSGITDMSWNKAEFNFTSYTSSEITKQMEMQ